MEVKKVVLLRHGESVWNKEDKFTGWTDVDLSPLGFDQAKAAGELLKKNGYVFDIAFTSYLKRAIKTLDIVLEIKDELWIPVVKSWRMNERFYGGLQGLNKAETVKKFGEEQVHKWRRDPYEHPPELSREDERYPGNDRKYSGLSKAELPVTENLSETMERVLPFWNEHIVPAIQQNQRVVISAHNNSLRALVKHIDHLSDEEVIQLDLPTGAPLIYEFDDQLQPLRHYYLK